MTVIGTLPYMAPEQLRGDPADPRTDIYAAGVVLYVMATGQLPFQERLPTALSDAILHHLPPPPGRLRPDLDARLEEIILKCLEKDPDLRYQSARDVLADFRRFQTASISIAASQPLTRGRSASAVAKGVARRVPPLWAGIGIPIAIVAAALLVLLWIRNPLGWRGSALGRPDPGAIESLAVLPFADLSGDIEQSYFVDGMTEAVITDLSKIRAIKVISRTSVMRYKGSTRSLPEIARELSVDAIVEGSVLRDGDRVRISAQLIDSRTDAHLWAETYQRDLRDVLSLQSEVAQAIAGGIRVNLTSDESARLAGTRRVDSRAYDAYLKGRYLWNQRTKEGLSRSLEYFRQAIAMDPGYAVAHAGLASAYAMGPSYSILPATEAYPQAQAAARKALELDDTLAEAHATLGWTKLEYEYDWAGAEAEFKRAIELEPGNVTAHQWYTALLVCTGRFAEARAENELALGLDPFSPPGNLWKAFLHFYSREFDKAVTELENLHEMHPQYGPPSQWIPIALALAGRRDEAAASCDRYVAESPRKETTGYCLAYPYAVAGRKEEARAILIENREHTTHYTQLFVLAALGENDEAIAELERAYAEREWQVPMLSVDPRLDTLRSDQRFRDVMSRMRYPGSPR
jgi:TolB-like protein